MCKNKDNWFNLILARARKHSFQMDSVCSQKKKIILLYRHWVRLSVRVMRTHTTDIRLTWKEAPNSLSLSVLLPFFLSCLVLFCFQFLDSWIGKETVNNNIVRYFFHLFAGYRDREREKMCMGASLNWWSVCFHCILLAHIFPFLKLQQHFIDCFLELNISIPFL